MTNNLKWSLCVGIVFLAAAGAYVYWQYFRDTWQPPSVVTIESDEELASIFPAYLTWVSDPEEGAPQALLLRDGDYMFTGFEVPVRYMASDGKTLKPTFNDGTLSLGDTTIALSLDEEEGRKWVSSASDQQLANLRILAIPDDMDAGTLAALKRLAAANPNMDLLAESATALRQALLHFKPRGIFTGDVDDASLEFLANQTQLETLLISGSKAGSLDYLPSLPKLRRLVIGAWKVSEAGPLPPGLSQLKSLVVFQMDAHDLSALSAVPAGLEELAIQNLKGVTDIAGLDKLTNLHALFLSGERDELTVDLPSLAALKQLRWAGLPPTISQKQFADFASAHPKLTILELPETETPIDLAPLRELKDLQGLVLGGTYENLEIIQEFTSLRFVGISKDIWDESSAQITAIRKALPDAVVIRVGTFCLGSGWILLLVPVLGFAWRRRISLPLAQQAA
jgi:hypothetical protein